MALTYSINNVENYEKYCLYKRRVDLPDDELQYYMGGDYIGHPETGEVWVIRAQTHNIIFESMSVGIGIVSERTLPEFWARAVVFNSIHGGRGVGFTLQDLREHIGLSTNVGKEETRTQWMKRIIGHRLDDIRYDVRKQVKELNI